MQYVLNDAGEPVAEHDTLAWSRWMATADRTVAKTFLMMPDGGTVEVSTVFLVLDHSHGMGVPQLFETMIFDLGEEEYQDRYATRAAALVGHAEYVKFVRARGGKILRDPAREQMPRERRPRKEELAWKPQERS